MRPSNGNPTPEICCEAIKKDVKALKYVPKEMRTEKIYLEAVKNDGTSLRYVPKNKQTLAIALAALRQNPESIEYLAPMFRTPEVCRAAGVKYSPQGNSQQDVSRIQYQKK